MRFGHDFELDLSAHRLTQAGRVVRLERIPAEILLLLVERRGQLVTRQEIVDRIWGHGVFLDTDNSINGAIRKIRQVLKDDAEQPRFVETITGRGYRFIAPVEVAKGVPETEIQKPSSQPNAVSAAPPVSAAPTERQPSRRRPILLAIAFVLVAVLGGYLWWSHSRSTRDSHPESTSMPMPLTSFSGIEGEAAWSPDGRQVAFVWNGEKEDNYDIYLLQPGSSQTLRLTTDPAIDESPAWSPDGRLIAYARTSADRSRYSLEVVSPLGGTGHTLLTKSTPLGAPNWTPNGRAVVIHIVPEPKRPAEVWAISVDTGKHRQLTWPPAGIVGDIGPSVSPDGKTLAFCRKTAWRTAELYFVDLGPDLSPAGQPRRVTDLGYVGRAAWTPDGARILFEAQRDGFGIWQVDRSATNVRPVFGVPNTATQPAIAKRLGGHTSLIFTSQVTDTSIWRYSTDQGPGGAPVELVPSSRNQSYPRYSSDGKKLAFSSTRTGHQEIWVASADGSHPVQLTDLRHRLTEVGHWSPGNDLIAFVSQDRRQRQIYAIGSAGGPAVQITDEDGVQMGSGWSHDGAAYYYTSSRSGRREVWKVPRGGGRPEQMTANGGEHGFESSRGVLYYWRQNPGQGASLMRRMPDGDQEVPLAPEGTPQSLTAPAPTGFYYKAAGTRDVYLYDESTGHSGRVLAPALTFNQFTISPDGQWFASTFLGKSNIDLMIMEHFK